MNSLMLANPKYTTKGILNIENNATIPTIANTSNNVYILFFTKREIPLTNIPTNSNAYTINIITSVSFKDVPLT